MIRQHAHNNLWKLVRKLEWDLFKTERVGKLEPWLTSNQTNIMSEDRN